MPHYVMADDQHSDEFALYSTVVDNTITAWLSGADMRVYLEGNDYPTWLIKDDEDLRAYYAEHHAWMDKALVDDCVSHELMYWNEEHGFWFVTLEDCYYVLPESAWRS